jgi:hypothetical protein
MLPALEDTFPRYKSDRMGYMQIEELERRRRGIHWKFGTTKPIEGEIPF